MMLTVVGHPNSRQEKIEEDLLGTLHVWTKEPPLEGRANYAITESLATYFKVNKARVELIAGAKSKNKIFKII